VVGYYSSAEVFFDMPPISFPRPQQCDLCILPRLNSFLQCDVIRRKALKGRAPYPIIFG
jgi:hypothetical protein